MDRFFIVKEIEVKHCKELVPFETKLPGDANRVTGYYISATKGDEHRAIAEVGISFNGARENTINTDVIINNRASVKRKNLPLSQNQLLIRNSYVKGYAEDKGVADTPYLIKIYFELNKK